MMRQVRDLIKIGGINLFLLFGMGFLANLKLHTQLTLYLDWTALPELHAPARFKYPLLGSSWVTWPWAWCLDSLHLSFHICKMGIVFESSAQSCY